MIASATAYPLQWPAGRERRPYHRREQAGFDTGMAAARDAAFNEVRLLGGKNVVLSSNVPLRQDGKPYANFPRIDDPAVALYFTYKDKPMCFACDRWTKVEDNIQAIRKTIEALRGIARWGTGDMLQAAFTGFSALPPPIVAGGPRHWRDVLEFGNGPANRDELLRNFRILRSTAHPDKGGSHDAMTELNLAYEAALKECA